MRPKTTRRISVFTFVRATIGYRPDSVAYRDRSIAVGAVVGSDQAREWAVVRCGDLMSAYAKEPYHLLVYLDLMDYFLCPAYLSEDVVLAPFGVARIESPVWFAASGLAEAAEETVCRLHPAESWGPVTPAAVPSRRTRRPRPHRLALYLTPVRGGWQAVSAGRTMSVEGRTAAEAIDAFELRNGRRTG